MCISLGLINFSDHLFSVYFQMTDGELCLLCKADNKRSFLHSYQINLEEAIVLCENPQVGVNRLQNCK